LPVTVAYLLAAIVVLATNIKSTNRVNSFLINFNFLMVYYSNFRFLYFDCKYSRYILYIYTGNAKNTVLVSKIKNFVTILN